MVILDRQTIGDIGLSEEVKSGDAEAVEAGLVLDAADSRQRWKKGLVGTFGSVLSTFPEFGIPRFLSFDHHHSQRFVDFLVTLTQVVDQLIRR